MQAKFNFRLFLQYRPLILVPFINLVKEPVIMEASESVSVLSTSMDALLDFYFEAVK